MTAALKTFSTLFCLGCAAGGGLRGQQTSDSSLHLDRLEAAVDSGRVEGVRATLDAWLASPGNATGDEIARARFLRARLMTDADSARTEYMALALDGRAAIGARAWLRIAQIDLAVGEAVRALSDLERLRADYPSSPAAAASWYWTARALEQSGDLDAACEGFVRAIVEARGAGDVRTIERATEASSGCGEGGLRFSLQLGAFSRPAAARLLAEELDEAGYESRIHQEDDLYKVRIGRFASPEAARGLAGRLRQGGFSVAVVASEP